MSRLLIPLLLLAIGPTSVAARQGAPDRWRYESECRERDFRTCTPHSLSVEDDYGRPCEAGDLVMCTVAGLILESGASGRRDVDQAVDLYRRSCDRGVPAACRRLELVREDRERPEDFDPFARVGFIADAYDGSPIAGATVHVRLTGERRVTNAAGRVDFGSLRRGRHEVWVTHPDYERGEGVLPVPWDTDFLMLLERNDEVAEGPEDDETGRLFGQITRVGDHEGIPNVEVTIVATNGTEQTQVTDANGRFNLAGLEAGEVDIRFRHVGYGVRETTATLEPGRTTEVAASMSSTPIPLEPITITVASGYLERSGFFRRMRRGLGDHFTRREILGLEPQEVSDLLIRVPGVTVQRGPDGAHLFSRRRQGLSPTATPCRVRPYVDGMRLVGWDFDSVRPNDLEGVEVFLGPEVPIEYRPPVVPGAEAVCGVLLIWTRDPR